MSSSSQQITCLTQSEIDALTPITFDNSTTLSNITLSDYSYDTSFLNSSANTITITSSAAMPTLTVGSGVSTTSFSNISPIDISQIILNREWESSFPDWHRIQRMCEKYPGLKIAFEKFKTTYHLVKDDYDNPNTKK